MARFGTMRKYRGFGIRQTWNGWKIVEQGAEWPETYGSLTDAEKSIDFELKNKAKRRQK